MHLRKASGLQKRWLKNNVSIMLALVVLTVLIFSIFVSAYFYASLSSGLRAKAKTTTDFFGNYISQSYNDYFQSCMKFAQSFEESDRLELQFISASGRLVASSSGPWMGQIQNTPDLLQAVETKNISVFTGKSPVTGERIMAASSPMIYTNGEVIGVLRYVTSMKTVDRQIVLISGVAILVGALFSFLILFSSSRFIRSIIDPVTEITATSKRIAAGSYGSKIQKQFDDEIGELADTINDLSVKISQAEKMQTEFISSVSHELRTPLTAISGWGETLLSAETPDPAETRRGMTIILRETRRLTNMVEDLLEFTRMQDGRFVLNVENCDILSEFEDTVFMYGSRLRQDGIELEYLENDDEIPEISCDPARLRQVFLNVLDNANKHGGDGKRITASMTYEDKHVVVRIRDFGPGIPEEELPHVKMKFYKGSSRVRGSGIGLAVCEEIVTMHGGSIALENAEGGGTLVTISLPSGEE
ncbi:MAG: sensor histidine kinase [Oscillospiraceae bacterium]|nr:sensor histidine kinase [Oscillospiraceae bacterium]